MAVAVAFQVPIAPAKPSEIWQKLAFQLHWWMPLFWQLEEPPGVLCLSCPPFAVSV